MSVLLPPFPMLPSILCVYMLFRYCMSVAFCMWAQYGSCPIVNSCLLEASWSPLFHVGNSCPLWLCYPTPLTWYYLLGLNITLLPSTSTTRSTILLHYSLFLPGYYLSLFTPSLFMSWTHWYILLSRLTTNCHLIPTAMVNSFTILAYARVTFFLGPVTCSTSAAFYLYYTLASSLCMSHSVSPPALTNQFHNCMPFPLDALVF